MNKIITVSIYISIFITSYVFFKTPFEMYVGYVVMAVMFPILFVKYGIPKLPLMIFAPLLVTGIVYIGSGDNDMKSFLKIFIGFFSSVLFYRYVLEIYDFNVDKLFRWYCKGAVIISILGVIQVIAYNFGIKPLWNYHWIFNKWGTAYGGLGIRMNSVFSEPAYFAAVIAPAFFTAVHNIFWRRSDWMKKWESFVIFGAFFLTFSSLGILAIFIGTLLLLLNYGFFRYAIVFIPLFYFGFGYVYENVPEFRERYDGTIDVFYYNKVNSYDVHGSSFVLYNAYVISTENFKRNPLFGTGLGSQEHAFDKYSLTRFADVVQIDFNKSDANSMFLRLLSETGLFGVVFMMVFVVRNYIPRLKSANDTNWIISNGILLIIIIYLARQGHYFLNGFPFFLWMYYYIRKKNTQMRREQAEEKPIIPLQKTKLIEGA